MAELSNADLRIDERPASEHAVRAGERRIREQSCRFVFVLHWPKADGRVWGRDICKRTSAFEYKLKILYFGELLL